MLALSPDALDEILALQLTVAWAGEQGAEPTRLGWWSSDLVNKLGGYDLFHRLAPRTHAWASLGLVRKVAATVDAGLRKSMAGGDGLWTLFHFGFDVDEALSERLAQHRAAERAPAEALGPRLLVSETWSPQALSKQLSSLGSPKTTTEPGGRRVSAKTGSALEAARLLAASLADLPARYPMPYLEPAR
jgi:hypothetical protein